VRSAFLALVLVNVPIGLSAQTQQLDSAALQQLTQAVHSMCVQPDRRGDFLHLDGNLDAGASLAIAGVSGQGKVSKEDWDGINQRLDQYKTDPRDCAVQVLKILVPSFIRPPASPPPVVNPPALPPSYAESYSFPTNLNPSGDNWLALRTDPGPGGVRTMKMGPDTLFTVLGEQGDWARVRLRTGETGWAAKAYIGCCKNAAPPAAQPVAEARYAFPTNLNPGGDNWLALRTEPGPGGVRIMKMGPDTLFTVVGEQGDWAHVRLRTGETGWAAKAYIGCCVSAPAIGSVR